MNTYQHTRSGIIEAGFNPEIIEGLGREIAEAKDLAEAEAAYSSFEGEAEKLPWLWDHDFGALVLQREALKASKNIAKFMLSKAINRAQWCATCATSGGEGLARASHMKQLESELAKYN